MKDYTSNTPIFSETIRITETSDPAHADNVNAAPIQLLQNTLCNHNEIAQLKKSTGENEYRAEDSYAPGDYCLYDNVLYKCIKAATGEWDPACWQQTSAFDEIEAINRFIRTDDFANIIKEAIIGATPSYYARGSLFTPERTQITIHANTQVNINGKGYSNSADVVLDTSGVAQAGKDVYVYACAPESGNELQFVLSKNSTVPDGYNADNSRKIGGFHCLCEDVGTISGHPLSDYVAGDILPASVWDLKHRSVSEPEGMVYVEGLGKWYDIYLASWDGDHLVSAFGGTIADGASARKYHGLKFNEDFGLIGKHLPSWDEFMVFAKGSNEQTAINGAADPGTTGGHKDTAGRRMISNDGLEDCCGVLWQWMHDSFDITSTNSNAAFTAGNRYINHNVFTSTEQDSEGHTQANTNWHIEPVYEKNVDERSYGWAYDALLVRLLAGGHWSAASMCGSRSAHANNFGACVSASLGGRGASEPRNAA